MMKKISKYQINNQFSNKTVLITGGTGSLGQALTKRLLNTKVKAIRIFSRNENKQVEMESKFNDKRLRIVLLKILILFFMLLL